LTTAAVIVAHPDDETLWCGGLMLDHPDWDWFVLSLCRAEDRDRAPRFKRVLSYLGAKGEMCDLDDGPEQQPLDIELIKSAIMVKLPRLAFDLVLTHGPRGEYTRHRRHEECCAAVLSLWTDRRIMTREMKLFAYQDQNGGALPQVSADADEQDRLGAETFARKYHIITDIYGFENRSWEAKTTPRDEGFYRLESPADRMALSQHLSQAGDDI
jgi:LmbE family N-acetylglucosaminyl deacetylase